MSHTAEPRAGFDRIQSSSGKLVYLYLATSGETTISELRDALGLSQVRLYPILSTLRDRDLIERREGAYVVAG